MSDRENAGGLGENPSRSDLALVRQALRQDWPIDPEVKERIVGRLVGYLDPDADGRAQPARTVIAAARTLAAFGGLSLKQALLDLQTRRAEGGGGKSALEIVAEAERLALAAEADAEPDPEPDPADRPESIDRDRSRGPPD